jgi:3-dehydroquinate synthetase
MVRIKFIISNNRQCNIEIKTGVGEMCHYFVVAGEKDFERFKNEYPLALKYKKVLAGLIARSLEIKKSYIEIIEFYRKKSQVFNYGHSFGHAIESLTDYRVPHGIAVAYGMDMANFISVKLGYITGDVCFYIRELLAQMGKRVPIKHISMDKFKTALKRDKKNVGPELRLKPLNPGGTGTPICIIEDLALGKIDNKIKKVIASPLFVENSNGPPVTVFAEVATG